MVNSILVGLFYIAVGVDELESQRRGKKPLRRRTISGWRERKGMTGSKSMGGIGVGVAAGHA